MSAKSPGELTRVLDRFLPESVEQQSRLDSARRKLKENGGRLVKAREQRDEIEAQIAQLPKLEEQVRQFKEQGLEEKLRQVPLLEKERQLGPRMMEEVARARSGQRQFEESLPDLVFLSDKALEGLPHAELLHRGRKILEALDETLRQKLGEIGKATVSAETALAALGKEAQASPRAIRGTAREGVRQAPSGSGQGRQGDWPHLPATVAGD